ncbi:MAG: hypothetical protein EOO88_34795 [Pedobacter sp.]|nr:MAG: hypothetical protein EOO88_34795 [Pedobacter sp.]
MLTEIFGVTELPPQQEIIKVYQTGQYLLAGYLTPYKTIKEGLRECFSLVARLLEDGLRGNSPLSALPPVQLIYLLAHGMSHTYGYAYFEDAITEAIAEKITRPVDDRDMYELFFLTTITAFLGKNNAFDALIKEHGKHLPELLKLGISHFNDDFSLRSEVTSKYIKKLHKGLRSRGNFHELIASLYDVPILESISKAQQSSPK